MNLQSNALLQGGKYKIEKMLGQGGFGITYLAVQTGLDRKVTIKEFFMKEYCNRDETTSSVTIGSQGSRELVKQFQTKFVKEARLIAAMDNPHIVRIYDIFEENDTAYYVMEYIHGGSLKELVATQGALTEERALDYIKQIADALSYIHEQKILHLDIKPANVLLRNGKDVVLIDFGISKRYDDTGGQTSTTPIGISKGYTPMEQYHGVGNFSPCTDIYSLGATIYYLLTGETPPEASIINDDGLPPLPATISTTMANVIEKAMQSRRKDRPQNIADFLKLMNHNLPSPTPEKTNKDEETIVSIPINASPKTNMIHPDKKKDKKTLIYITLLQCIALVSVLTINHERLLDFYTDPQSIILATFIEGFSICFAFLVSYIWNHFLRSKTITKMIIRSIVIIFITFSIFDIGGCTIPFSKPIFYILEGVIFTLIQFLMIYLWKKYSASSIKNISVIITCACIIFLYCFFQPEPSYICTYIIVLFATCICCGILLICKSNYKKTIYLPYIIISLILIQIFASISISIFFAILYASIGDLVYKGYLLLTNKKV